MPDATITIEFFSEGRVEVVANGELSGHNVACMIDALLEGALTEPCDCAACNALRDVQARLAEYLPKTSH